MDARLHTPEILNSILAALQRLEGQLDDHNGRLSNIESSMKSHSDASSISPLEGLSPPPRSLARRPLSHQQPGLAIRNGSSLKIHSPAAYMASIVKLRNRFEFDGRSVDTRSDDSLSEFELPEDDDDGIQGRTMAEADNDWHSMSIYSSRPISGVSDIPPVPPLRRDFQQSVPLSIGPAPNDFAQSVPEMRLSQYYEEIDNALASHYEEEALSPALTDQASIRNSCSESGISESTAPTSFGRASSVQSKHSFARPLTALRMSMDRFVVPRRKPVARSPSHHGLEFSAGPGFSARPRISTERSASPMPALSVGRSTPPLPARSAQRSPTPLPTSAAEVMPRTAANVPSQHELTVEEDDVPPPPPPKDNVPVPCEHCNHCHKPKVSLRQVARQSGKSCAKFMSSTVARVARAMVNQQLKMLESRS